MGAEEVRSPVQLHLLCQHFLTDGLDVIFQLQDACHMVSLLSAQNVPLFYELPVGPGEPLQLRLPQKNEADTSQGTEQGLRRSIPEFECPSPPYPVSFLEKETARVHSLPGEYGHLHPTSALLCAKN